jgi:hypothetical protein
MVKINSVKFAEIVVDGKTYYSDVIVWWNGNVELIEKKHVLDVSDMAPFIEKKAEAIVIGTGQSDGVKLLPEVKQVLEDKNIKLYVETSPDAIEIFNSFAATGKKAAALIHTTC